DALEPAVAGAEDVPRFGDDELPGPRLADDSRRVTKRVRAGELDCADHRVGGRVEHDEPTPARGREAPRAVETLDGDEHAVADGGDLIHLRNAVVVRERAQVDGAAEEPGARRRPGI